MQIRTIAAMAVLAVATSGCASIVKGSSETIAIHTVPSNGAVCTLSNPRGKWRVSAPGRVKVKRSSEDMDVTCKALGYTDARGTISSDFQTWTLGNILIGGAVGLIVDWSTGAINDYEHRFEIPMYPADGNNTPGMRIPLSALPAS
jgi:hypothetical protein